MIQTLLIGDNAFIGVSHLSQLRARETLERLDIGAIINVFDKAIHSGASGFVFSIHPTNLEILKVLAATGRLASEVGLYPILPYAAGYVRQMNENGAGGVLSEILARIPLTDKAKIAMKGGLSAIKLDPLGLLDAYVDMELSGILKIAPKSVRAVFLHEVVTDLVVSFQASGVFDSFMRHVRSRYNAKPGFVTRNLPRLVKFAEDSGIPLKDIAIMSPFNSAGFQMNPSKESCESCLPKLTNCSVIAMSILAGGYLTLEDAVDYLRKLPYLSGVVVGVSSEEHAQQTFTRLRSVAAELKAT
jgi:hypothetical protein